MRKTYPVLLAKQAYKDIWTKGTAWGGTVSGLLPLAVHIRPGLQPSMNDLAWQIPVFALAGAAAFRIALAPYELWKEQKLKAEAIPPENRPFNISLWDQVDEFALYQAACLWVERPPPATSSGRLPDEAIIVLHRLKRALHQVAQENRHSLFSEGNGWVQAYILLSMGSPDREVENSLVVSRSGLEACAEQMGDTPAFLYEDCADD